MGNVEGALELYLRTVEKRLKELRAACRGGTVKVVEGAPRLMRRQSRGHSLGAGEGKDGPPHHQDLTGDGGGGGGGGSGGGGGRRSTSTMNSAGVDEDDLDGRRAGKGGTRSWLAHTEEGRKVEKTLKMAVHLCARNSALNSQVRVILN